MSHAPKPLPTMSDAEQGAFWAKVAKGLPGDCWPWRGAKHPFGYGIVLLGGRRYLAHRVSLALAGRIRDGLALHHCDNPPCVNPDHLYEGTPAQNMRDKVARGRARGMPRGGGHPSARLTQSQVVAMRAAYAAGEAIRDIASRVGISKKTAQDAIYGRTWRHI